LIKTLAIRSRMLSVTLRNGLVV